MYIRINKTGKFTYLHAMKKKLVEGRKKTEAHVELSVIAHLFSKIAVDRQQKAEKPEAA